MNISIICVGKLKEAFWKDAAGEYIKRLGRFGKVSITELAESKTDDVSEESSRICQKLAEIGHGGSASFIFALDIGGKSYSSEAFAEKINNLGISGISNLIFVIGGSNGYDDSVRALANERISFSDFTFPHQLMRVILLEQIYRSFKINANEKYHK